MHVVTINRPGMNDHLVGARRLTHQLSAPLPHIPTEDREPIFRNPYNVVLAVPDHMAAAFVTLHATVYTGHPRVPYRLKAWGFLIPYRDSKHEGMLELDLKNPAGCRPAFESPFG